MFNYSFACLSDPLIVEIDAIQGQEYSQITLEKRAITLPNFRNLGDDLKVSCNGLDPRLSMRLGGISKDFVTTEKTPLKSRLDYFNAFVHMMDSKTSIYFNSISRSSFILSCEFIPKIGMQMNLEVFSAKNFAGPVVFHYQSDIPQFQVKGKSGAISARASGLNKMRVKTSGRTYRPKGHGCGALSIQ